MGTLPLNKTIAELSPWDFLAQASSIGLEPDDLIAIESGNALPDQINRMKELCECARSNLITAEVNEPRRSS